MPSRSKKRQEFEATALVYLDNLYGAAFRLARNRRDAEDLVQETLLRAYRSWESFQKGSSCKAWLFKILNNAFIDSYQRSKRRRETVEAASAEQRATDGVLFQERSEAQRTPEEVLLEGGFSEVVDEALASLPEDFKVAVVLCDVEGFSYREIAEIVGCPVGTVMSRLHRGRRHLQTKLRDHAIARGILPADEGRDADPIRLDAYRR